MNEKPLTIRKFSKETGWPEYMIRQLVKAKKLPVIFTGNRAMLPYSLCLEALHRLASENQS